MKKKRINEPLDLGLRCINGLLTCGRGQRIGIFAGSGVGKSVLMGMIARHTEANVNVIGLIGERGREVREFIEKDLGDGLKRSVVIVATSDQASACQGPGGFSDHRHCGVFPGQRRGRAPAYGFFNQIQHGPAGELVWQLVNRQLPRGIHQAFSLLLTKLLERAGNGESEAQ